MTNNTPKLAEAKKLIEHKEKLIREAIIKLCGIEAYPIIRDIEALLDDQSLISYEKGREERRKEFEEVKNRLEYFYLQTDGTMNFPNSAEGDIFKIIYKILNLSIK